MCIALSWLFVQMLWIIDNFEKFYAQVKHLLRTYFITPQFVDGLQNTIQPKTRGVPCLTKTFSCSLVFWWISLPRLTFWIKVCRKRQPQFASFTKMYKTFVTNVVSSKVVCISVTFSTLRRWRLWLTAKKFKWMIFPSFFSQAFLMGFCRNFLIVSKTLREFAIHKASCLSTSGRNRNCTIEPSNGTRRIEKRRTVCQKI